MSIAIVDYGVGNLGSIVSMLRKLGIRAERVTEPGKLADFERFILPGVGSFDDAVDRLDSSRLRPELERLVRVDGRPLLGICLGMQLLAESSEEGQRPGLGWVPGRVRELRTWLPPEARIPFMGWGYIDQVSHHELLGASDEAQRYYFAHSYAFDAADKHLIATVDYGVDVPAIVGNENVLGTQFHPEKSHRFGMALLTAFNEIGSGR